MKKKNIVQGNINNNSNSFEIKPQRFELTDLQKEILSIGTHKNTKMLILDGCAGTSKSYLATLIGLILLQQKRTESLTYIRTSVQPKDSQLGFLSGDLKMKTDWMNQVFFDKLDEFLTKPVIDKLGKDGKLNTLTSCFLRGLNSRGVWIFDESQNAFFSSLRTCMERISEHSLLIMCGDSSGAQNDLGQQSGFKQIIELFNNKESQENGIIYYKLDSNQVVRSRFVKFIIKKFENLK